MTKIGKIAAAILMATGLIVGAAATPANAAVQHNSVRDSGWD